MMDPNDHGHFDQHHNLRDMTGGRTYRQGLYSQNPYAHSSFPVDLHDDDHLFYLSQQQQQPPPQQQQMFFQDAYGTYVVDPRQQLDEAYLAYGPEFTDFPFTGMAQDEFGDMEEISTRPRLTKDQVEVLESQFQANHKPNSQVKRQLAFETKLTLPRVAVRSP